MVAILFTFALCSAVSVSISIWATTRVKHQATIVQIAARQRSLAERYVGEVLLAKRGVAVDSAKTAELMRASADALLNGGAAPSVDGFDDETTLPRAQGEEVRAQLRQELRLVADLAATGDAVLHGRPVQDVRLTAHEHPAVKGPVERLRILAALTSNVS